VGRLHRRAGAWFESQALVDEALHHILAAKDYAWAARLVERAGSTTLWEQGAHGTVQRWIEALPDEAVRARPRLCLLYAWPLYTQGRLEPLESYLLSAEASFKQRQGPQEGQGAPVLAEEPRADELQESDAEAVHVMGVATALRALAALRRGEISQALELTEDALTRLPEDNVHLRAILTHALGHVNFRRGEMNAAQAAFTEATALGWASRKPFMTVSSRVYVILAQGLQGRFRAAGETCRQLQRGLRKQGRTDIPAAAALSILRGWLMWEWNDLDAAAEEVRRGIERSKRWPDERLIFGYVMLARIVNAQGDIDGAHRALEEAAAIEKRLQFTRFRSNMPPVAAYRARIQLAHGEGAAAARWAREQGLAPHDEVSFQREVEHLTLARLLIAQNRADDALGLLKRLRKAAEAGGRAYRAIEARVLEALALYAQRKTAAALEALEEALRRAEPERLVRVFLEEGLPMARLLYLATRHEIVPDFARTLLKAFAETSEVADEEAEQQGRTVQSGLIDPLTKRELEVLTLIARELSNQEISEQLFVSPNTVKTHIRNLYGKLGASRRSQAVAQAHALGLLQA
jgi:LuxR family maltose regulon positive regulatory protein